MAARSPNVRLQKAISRKNQRYGTDSIHLSWMLHLNSAVLVRFISRILILLQLDAEMPAICTAEASEGSVREAERGDGGRR
jgi:hypothetical protein